MINKIIMRRFFVFVLLLVSIVVSSFAGVAYKNGKQIKISKEKIRDKIKGGWAGKVIGCTYGFPTEFRYCGTMLQDYIPIRWEKDDISRCFKKTPHAFDDVYMNLTFLEVFARLGLEAPVDSFALSFANAKYGLCHANQAARYNILKGIMPPMSGYWKNNPHADDIDYQIEADYAGLMTPGMINSCAIVSDSIGHIMNYGDGWYGGVYVGAMYSLAFVYDDVEYIVKEALKVIPLQSKFYKCMDAVIKCYEKDPNDWKQAWYVVERNFSTDLGCPDGVFKPYNIDATVNSAYVIIGLLYGNGDYGKTIDISTRCGQDSDCNPSTSAGILGTIIGYDKIPEYWKGDIESVSDINFIFTSTSLNKACDITYDLALKMIEREGGSIGEKDAVVIYQVPKPVGFEECFEGIRPTSIVSINKTISQIEQPICFEGTGAIFRGRISGKDHDYVAEVECYIDGKLVEKALLPDLYTTRRPELFWFFDLKPGKHTATFKWLNPQNGMSVNFTELVIYDSLGVK